MLSAFLLLAFLIPSINFGKEVSDLDKATGNSEIREFSSTQQLKTPVADDEKEMFETVTSSTASAESLADTSLEVPPAVDAPENNVRPASETGSVEDPFLVDNFAELETAVASDVSGIKYIQLTNNILINDTGKLSIKTDTVIDGSNDGAGNFTLNYTGGNGISGGLFATGKNDLTITFKNLNFGSAEYLGSTYYGFLTTNNTGTVVNIENVVYQASAGGQPFYASRADNTLNFSGINEFKVSPGASSQEFSEGYGIINFKEDSQTTIYQNTNSSEGVFWLKSQITGVVTVEENAVVDITSGKHALFYANSSLDLRIQKNARFHYKKMDGEQTSNDFCRIATQPVITVAEQGEFLASTADKGLDLKSATFQATDPKQIQFTTEENNSNSAIASGSLSIKNSGQGLYQLIDETNTVLQTVTAGEEAKNITYQNKRKVVYVPAITFDQIGVRSEVGTRKSDAILGLQTINSSLDATWQYRGNYVLTKQRLADSEGLINQTEVNRTYESDPATDSGLYISVSEWGNSESSTEVTIPHVLAGEYYVYGRIEAENKEETFTTQWQETPLNVTEFIQANLADQLTFKSPKETVGMDPLTGYQLENTGNLPIQIYLAEVGGASTSDAEIALVQDYDANNPKSLWLNCEATVNDQTTSWNLLAGKVANEAKITLRPYWKDAQSRATLNLTGNFSGPYDKVRTVGYDLNFKVTKLP